MNTSENSGHRESASLTSGERGDAECQWGLSADPAQKPCRYKAQGSTGQLCVLLRLRETTREWESPVLQSWWDPALTWLCLQEPPEEGSKVPLSGQGRDHEETVSVFSIWVQRLSPTCVLPGVRPLLQHPLGCGGWGHTCEDDNKIDHPSPWHLASQQPPCTSWKGGRPDSLRGRIREAWSQQGDRDTEPDTFETCQRKAGELLLISDKAIWRKESHQGQRGHSIMIKW